MNQYIAGQIIEFTALFKDDNGNPVDPTTVAFKYRAGTGPKVTLNYTNATTPAVGVIAHTGIGSYKAQVDTTSLAADTPLDYEWQSTGTGQTVGSGRVYLQSTAL